MHVLPQRMCSRTGTRASSATMRCSSVCGHCRRIQSRRLWLISRKSIRAGYVLGRIPPCWQLLVQWFCLLGSRLRSFCLFNLQYVTEAVAAVAEAPIKTKDIPAAVEVM
jgi:hypothetical protein